MCRELYCIMGCGSHFGLAVSTVNLNTAAMEVVVTEEKKKIFRARKTMKISDRQQLETLHSTLFTAASSSSEPSPPPPLMNGSHREDGQKDMEQNSHQDSNSPIATSPASMTSLSSPAPFLSLNLSPSPVPSQSPKEKDEPFSGPSSPFQTIDFEQKKEEENSLSLQETSEAAAAESKEPQDSSKEAQTPAEKTANEAIKDSAKGSASLPPESDGTVPMETNATMADDAARIKSPSTNSSIPSASSSVDIKQDKDIKQETSKDQQKRNMLKQDKMEVTVVKVEAKKIKTESEQSLKPPRPSSTPPSGTASEKNCSSGIKRTLSEGFDKEGQTIKRDGKRPKMDQGELEAQLELKITAKAGSHHKLEKIVQQLVSERLKALEMAILEESFQDLKGRVDKIECATKHQMAIHSLQAKIARLSKKFGEANQASENKRKHEALVASSAIAAAAAAVASAAATTTTKTSVINTPQVQRPVRTPMELKQIPTTAVTLPHTAAKSGSLVPTSVSSTTAMVSQAPILKLITSSSNAVSTLATGITTQSPTGTLLLKTAPGSSMMTGQPLIIQLPVSMTNGQTGTLVNFPVSSLPTASTLNKNKTTASTTTYIIKPAPVTTTAAGSIPTPITVPALQAPPSQMSSGQLSLTRAVYQGGAGSITTPNAGVSVTPARSLISTVSVAGAMSTASSSSTSVPAATGSAAPGPPQGTSLTSKTENQAAGTTPSKAVVPVARNKGAVIDLTEDDDDVQVTGVKVATIQTPSLNQRPNPINILNSAGARSSPQSSQNASSSNSLVQSRPQLSNTTCVYKDPEMAPLKRHAYDAEFKLKALSYAAVHGNRAAAREFKVNESMIRKWKKQENNLSQVKKTQKSFRGNKARWPQLEDKLEQWVVEQRSANRKVCTVSIRMKATELAQEMNITEFHGGPSWCFRFMKRRNLLNRKRSAISQQLPKDGQEKVSKFHAYCKKIITEKKIQPEHITNMDEVTLSFDIPLNDAVEKTGTSTGDEKTSFTVVLACQANGNKLPPMVIFKKKTLPKKDFPAGIVIEANSNGCMDEDTMCAWLREIFVKRPGGFFHISPSLLIYNSTCAHITDAIKKQVKKTNSELAVNPDGSSKELQPLSIGVNGAFKARMQAAWKQWMAEGEHTFTKTGRQRQVTCATICQWIVDAWADISISTVVRAFTKAGIISELPGNSSDTDLDNDEREPDTLVATLTQLLNWDMEEEEFEG
ncbi:activating transcription factor 7-interacting protein 1 isoform X2 [Syngnathus scovelli]|uniref:activating transcription factor 7-interacting protein 1 isoform X2 n=1 Tax=Syngnathus scovelli TaxID=161590 RepID=UPI00210FCE2A|nr:activating transcription factor 7-interacting protein 1 isoform X2 [Syngnathus scovelli]